MNTFKKKKKRKVPLELSFLNKPQKTPKCFQDKYTDVSITICWVNPFPTCNPGTLSLSSLKWVLFYLFLVWKSVHGSIIFRQKFWLWHPAVPLDEAGDCPALEDRRCCGMSVLTLPPYCKALLLSLRSRVVATLILHLLRDEVTTKQIRNWASVP